MPFTYTAEKFIKAIPGTGGIITQIARNVPCNWRTVRDAIKKYPTVAAAYEAEREAILDLSESVVYGNIQAAHKLQRETGYTVQVDSSDAKWLLAYQGKHRGYDKSVGVQHGGEIVIRFEWEDLAEDDDDE